TRAFAALARTMAHSDTELVRTARIDGEGTYRLRGCEVRPGVVLVSAAPVTDVEETVERLITVQVVVFALALAALVAAGRRMLRRGLEPLSDMARTAHGIASHDLTESAARLPLRADGRDGGREVAELRTAFNTMLEHIDDSLAVRAEAEQRLRRFVADASHEPRTPPMSVRGGQRARGARAAPGPAARGGRPDGGPAGRPAAARPAGRGRRAGPAAHRGDGRGGAGPAGRRRLPGGASGPPADGVGGDRAAAAAGPGPDPAGPGQPPDQRGRAHPARDAGVGDGADRAGRGADPGRRRGPWHPGGAPGAGLRPLLPRRPGPQPRPGRQRA